jgi:hypothetical protein
LFFHKWLVLFLLFCTVWIDFFEQWQSLGHSLLVRWTVIVLVETILKLIAQDDLSHALSVLLLIFDLSQVLNLLFRLHCWGEANVGRRKALSWWCSWTSELQVLKSVRIDIICQCRSWKALLRVCLLQNTFNSGSFELILRRAGGWDHFAAYWISRAPKECLEISNLAHVILVKVSSTSIFLSSHRPKVRFLVHEPWCRGQMPLRRVFVSFLEPFTGINVVNRLP